MLKHLAVVAILCPVAGSALEREGGNNQTYDVTTNQHGAILDGPSERLYMGKDCDVISSTGARGQWSWSNAGFAIVLETGRVITFERQDVPISNGGACWQ